MTSLHISYHLLLTPNLQSVEIYVTDSVVTLRNMLTEVPHNSKIVGRNLKPNDQIESLRKFQVFQSRLELISDKSNVWKPWLVTS